MSSSSPSLGKRSNGDPNPARLRTDFLLKLQSIGGLGNCGRVPKSPHSSAIDIAGELGPVNGRPPLPCGRWSMPPEVGRSPSCLQRPLTLHASSLSSTEVRDDLRLGLLLSLEPRDNALLNPRHAPPDSRSFDLVRNRGVAGEVDGLSPLLIADSDGPKEGALNMLMVLMMDDVLDRRTVEGDESDGADDRRFRMLFVRARFAWAMRACAESTVVAGFFEEYRSLVWRACAVSIEGVKSR